MPTVDYDYSNQITDINDAYIEIHRSGNPAPTPAKIVINSTAKNIPGISNDNRWTIYGDIRSEKTGRNFAGKPNLDDITIRMTLDTEKYALFTELLFSKEELIVYYVYPDKGVAVKHPVCEVVSVPGSDEVESSGGEPQMTITFLQRGGGEENLPSTVTWPVS